MSYKITLAQAEPTWVAVVRDRVQAQDLSRFVPAACGEVWSFIRAAKLPKPGRHVAVYLDGQEHVEVGAEVSEKFAGNERVHCSLLPSGRAVTTTHYGPYAGLGAAHAAIRAWCAQHGHQCSAVSWEVYGHWEETWSADASQIRTDVFYLLA
ncbi:effector-binding domain-containing protein [Roseimicrobium gellanilyticum]|uniref:Effector-binding domain-containing protein n=1 Tax=Roseimicrobium gellanilyticum TaxID=748857 RepID=A0A366HM17_9BACT|nr:GyrI-like domain-containing protein [Roseimicrobium gellanilyticum]RBP44192.1 effector-binding domain-containing protein [Roseimicrobium gellanilyticum]